ncbi:hypothetical protein M0R72_12750 [Candidatus Pacearchaeota archaeon]|jgi:hypothetical protein|nr:hypothetical protein [Candidatus Pacearchaeota archaeon]
MLAENESAIRVLIVKGWSDSSIATKLHVGRDTVRRVRTGGKNRELPSPVGEFAPDRVKPYWCDVCRAWVIYKPCPACYVRYVKLGKN